MCSDCCLKYLHLISIIVCFLNNCAYLSFVLKNSQPISIFSTIQENICNAKLEVKKNIYIPNMKCGANQHKTQKSEDADAFQVYCLGFLK